MAIEIRIYAIRSYDECSKPEYCGDPEYKEADEQRIAAWNRDEWHFVDTHVRIVKRNMATGTSVTYASSYVGGLESDAPDSCFDECFREQFNELQEEYPELKSISFENVETRFE